MNKAHYIIFHPEYNRLEAVVQATVLVKNQIIKNWTGNVWVDCFRNGEGNEDPFVFNDPWLYSYCHASQLRRYSQKQSYLQSEDLERIAQHLRESLVF